MISNVPMMISNFTGSSFAQTAALSEHPDECALYRRAAWHVWKSFLAYSQETSASFFRIGGSFGQGLALFKHADLDLIFFFRPANPAYFNDHHQFMKILTEWAQNQASVPAAHQWYIELLPGCIRAKSVTLRLLSAVSDWYVDVDITVALDIQAGLSNRNVNPKLAGLSPCGHLSMDEARNLYSAFHASIRIILESSNLYERDSPGSRASLIREQAKSYVDCLNAFTHSLPLYVRHAIIILKSWTNQHKSQILSRLGVFNENESQQVLKKCYLSSYALTVLVVFLSRRLNDAHLGKLVRAVLLFLVDLRTCEEGHISIDDFYDPAHWPQFKRRQDRALYIRDPVNPTNDLAFGTSTDLLVDLGRSALYSADFMVMLRVGPPQPMAMKTIMLPSDADVLCELAQDILTRYFAAKRDLERDVANDSSLLLQERRLAMLFKSLVHATEDREASRRC